ncbi:MAG: SPOR domain-containing protein [Saprospiraceae bacterium]
MNLSILLISFTFLFSETTTPNFYPGYPDAREASKKSGKEMIIFFTKGTCDQCNKAWDVFSKDPQATNQFISTKMDIADFDGGVFYEMLNLESYPAWVIFTPDGKEKERWTGGWKDASGKPTKIEVDKSIVTTSSPNPKPTHPHSSDSEKMSTETKSTKSSTDHVNTPTSSINSNGFVLQAGYFGSEANAEKMMADLKAKGFNSFSMKTVDQNGTKFFRIISNAFETEEIAIMENKKMMVAGFKASIKNMDDL